MKAIGAVILAAGASTRLGRPKQLLRLEGEELLRLTACRLIDVGCMPVVVVLGAFVAACRAVVVDLKVEIVVNDRWREGMGSSIAAGIAAVAEAGADAALIAVCDQPRLSVPVLQRLAAAYPGRGIVASKYDATLGTPAIFAAEYFPALRRLSGKSGAKQLIRQHESDVVAVDMPEAATDIDSAGDWEALGGS
jgi:molybdenum cofactor cytidylyltransferase